MSTTSEIILCYHCLGRGVIYCKELIDYHHGDYRHWTETCTVCKGTGRMEQTTTITLKQLEESNES